MRDNKKIMIGSAISLGVIVLLGIIYAAFTQQLNINGSATGRSSKWKVYFSRLTGPTLNGTAKELEAPEIKNNSTTIGDYSVSVTSPGDYIEYEFDVTNDGDYDAKLTGLTKNSNTGLTYTGSGSNKTTDEDNVKSQIEYTLTYADGTTILENDTLKSKETKTMKLKLLYKTFDDASLLPQEDVSISGLGITLTYSQDSNAKVNSDGTTPYVKQYAVGDTFTLNGDGYHIISANASDDYVVALKDTPLTVAEITAAGGTANDNHGDGSIGLMAYGSDSTYATSAVKIVVDSWVQSKFTNSELKTVDGYTARLIKHDEIPTERKEICTGSCYEADGIAYDWMYISNCFYWTMSPFGSSSVWGVGNGGSLGGFYLGYNDGVVRPVINVYKSSIES